MGQRFILAFGAAVICGLLTSANGSTIGITNYTQFTGAALNDFPSGNGLPVRTIGSVTITPSYAFGHGSFVSFPLGGVDDPGSGNGYTTSPPLTLTFSQPVAGFGATFMHFVLQPPSKIEAFSATDQLLGSVLSSGYVSGGATPDFVAVWSNATDIAKVRLSTSGSDFSVDAYALTLTPDVPEPTFAVVLPAVVGLMAGRRRR
jgi:hypothetical protein